MRDTWPGLAAGAVLITGGAQGIGYAIARRFLEVGAQVVVIDKHPESAQIIETLWKEVGDAPPAWGIVADVRKQHHLERVRDWLVTRDIPVNVVIPNAGVNARVPLLDASPATVRDIVETNLLGVISTLQVFVPLIFERKDPRVIVTSSISAVHGMVVRAPYTATKAALTGLVRSLALEWGPRGITVNAVAPGVIRTPLTAAYMEEFPEKVHAAVANTALRRIGTPEEVADVVVFLASNAARFITGQTIYVDGGLTAGSNWW